MKMIYLSPGSIQEADPSAESSYGKTITLSFHNIIINNFIIMATLKKKRITPLYAPVNKKKRTRRRRRAAGGEGTNCRSSIERRWIENRSEKQIHRDTVINATILIVSAARVIVKLLLERAGRSMVCVRLSTSSL